MLESYALGGLGHRNVTPTGGGWRRAATRRPFAAIVSAGAIVLGMTADAVAFDPAPAQFATSQEIVAEYAAGLTFADLDGVLGDEILFVSQSRLRIVHHLGHRVLSAPIEVPVPGSAVETFLVHDFDRDGVPDLVAASDDSLTFLRGLGGLSFAPAQAQAVSPSSDWVGRWLVKGDLDGDGWTDVLVAAGDSVQGFRWAGVGGFVALPTFGFEPPGSQPALLDFDGDGRADLARCQQGQGTSQLAIHPGLGDGSFGSPSLLGSAAPGFTGTNPLPVDLDRDGDMDLVYGTPQGTMRWLRNDGNGSYTLIEWTGVTFAFESPALGVGDLDHDGALDVVVPARVRGSGESKDLVQVVFDAARSDEYWVGCWHALERGRYGVDVYGAAVGDVDADGWLDVGTNAGAWQPVAVILWNAGDGTLLSRQEVRPALTQQFQFWNGSLVASRRAPLALPDLVAPYDGGLRLMRNHGNGVLVVSDDLGDHPVLAAGDLSGNGADDLIVADAAGLQVLLRDPVTGVFHPHGPPVAAGSFIALADFDGDGHLDLAVENASTLLRLPGDGDGGFGPPEPMGLTFPETHGPVLATDLNGDGRSDFVWSPLEVVVRGFTNAEYRAAVHGHLTDTSGRLGLASTDTVVVKGTSLCRRTFMLASGDVDGDGDADIVLEAAKCDRYWFGVFLNDGAGLLAAAGPGTPGGQYGGPLCVRDLNGDGLADVAIHQSDGSEWDLDLFMSRGDGSFSELPYLTGGRSVIGMVVEDFNGDGLPDIAAQGASFSYGEGLVILRNVTPAPPPTPALAAFSAARFEDGAIALAWSAPGGGAFTASIERALDDGPWATLATVTADGAGRGAFLDRDVVPGRRHGYRLRYDDGGLERASAEAWVDVPRLALALRGPFPNPADAAPRFEVELPARGEAALEVFDVAGRRVWSRPPAALAAGRHRVALDGAALAPGLYLARLRSGAGTAAMRFVVVR